MDDSDVKVEKVKWKTCPELVEWKGTINGEVTSSWALLIHRIFEVDPLCCKKCGGEMKIIAFITNHSETLS